MSIDYNEKPSKVRSAMNMAGKAVTGTAKAVGHVVVGAAKAGKHAYDAVDPTNQGSKATRQAMKGKSGRAIDSN